MIPVTLHTERLELSTPTTADIDAIFDACQDPEVQRWTTVPVPYERKHAVGFIDAVVGPGWENGTETTWALRLEGQLIGVVSLFDIGHGKAALGYWMHSGFRRLGLLGEACRAVIDFGFSPAPEGLGLQCIAWRAFDGNIGSASAARPLGFRFDGVLRLTAVAKDGTLTNDWVASILATDDRTPVAWSVLAR